MHLHVNFRTSCKPLVMSTRLLFPAAKHLMLTPLGRQCIVGDVGGFEPFLYKVEPSLESLDCDGVEHFS